MVKLREEHRLKPYMDKLQMERRIFSCTLATTCILIQENILPLWFGLFLLLRFTIPLFAAVVSYFLFTHPVQFGSTLWGKAAGLALCFYFLLLLAPEQLMLLTTFLNRPLLILTLLLLAIAPLAQISRNLKDRKFR